MSVNLKQASIAKGFSRFAILVGLIFNHLLIGSSFANEIDTLQSLKSNDKLSSLSDVLSPFESGAQTTKVVVSLQPSSAANTLSIKSHKSRNGSLSTSQLQALANTPVGEVYYDLSQPEIKAGLAAEVKSTLNGFINELSDLTVSNAQSRDQASNQTRDQAASTTPAIKVTNKFIYTFGFAADVTLEGLNYLLNHDDVLLVEENLILTPQLNQGISVMNGASARTQYNGAGVAVAIVDTGVDDTHPDLNGGKVLGGYDFGDDDTNFRPNGNAHGTAVAGIVGGDINTVGDYIGGVAPGAKLYGLKISSGSSGSATSADMVDAWEWVITHQNDDPSNPILVVNTSFGGGRYFSSCNGANSAMTQAALNGVNAGMTHFVSSGNDGYCDSMGWPACITHVNSVGAVYDADIGTAGWCVSTSSCLSTSFNSGCPAGTEAYFEPFTAADRVTAYSNSDSNLTIFAPSNNSYTPDISGSAGYSSGNYTDDFGGTSAAAPYSSGAAAVLQSAAKSLTGSFLSPAEVRSIFESTGTLITDPKVAITKPRVNLGAAVDSLIVDGPDLVVSNPAVNSPQLNANAHFTFSATVENQGNESSAATDIRYYRSLDNIISTSDTYLDQQAVPGLNASASHTDDISLAAPSGAGTYYIGACVNDVLDELDTANNCSSAVRVEVSLPAVPDSYEEDDISDDAKVISNGETQTRSIHDFGDNDWVKFTVDEDVSGVIITTDGGSVLDDTRIRLLDESFTQIALDNNSGDHFYSKITLPTLAKGTYYIVVNEVGNNDTISNYTLSLSYDLGSFCLPIKASNGKIAVICL